MQWGHLTKNGERRQILKAFFCENSTRDKKLKQLIWGMRLENLCPIINEHLNKSPSISMPLRAILNGNPIHAFEYTQLAWDNLKQTYKDASLHMPCCATPAIPKTSHRGTKFFSHIVRGDCTSEAESPEHLYVKTVIAQAVMAAGWEVMCEERGSTPAGEEWIADVFCWKGNARIALEVQLSYQPVETLRARQQRYLDSGVRSAWFLSSQTHKPDYITPSKELPCFHLSNVVLEEQVMIPAFDVELKEFISGILAKKLTWEAPSPVKTACIDVGESCDILVYLDTCHRCNKPVKQIYGWAVGVYGDHAKTVPNASTVLEQVLTMTSNMALRKAGANTIVRDTGQVKYDKFAYANACIHCGIVQNNYYLLKRLRDNQQGGEDGLLEVNVPSIDSDTEWALSGRGKWIYTP